MQIIKKSKTFWVTISFITFLMFSLAFILKLYWLNFFVMILGLWINKIGSPILFNSSKKQKFNRKLGG